MKKTVISIIATFLAVLCLASCSSAPLDDALFNYSGGEYKEELIQGEPFFSKLVEGDDDLTDEQRFIENPYIKTADEATSTFSTDVDTASYAYFRKLINEGCGFDQLKAFAAGLRTEEMVNYFTYDYQDPADGEVFSVCADIVDCPWNPAAALLRLGLKARDAAPVEGNNLVFLIDVSGSMKSRDKLPLLQSAFTYLIENLSENDTVSIVTYSGSEKVVLEGCVGSDKMKILSAVQGLCADGVTNGEAGLQMAYRIAEKHFIEGGNNRIIMASDGDLNVGISSSEELKSFVSDMKASGVYLSVLGFGTGNYRDANMEALADNGNGVYYYIDGDSEAEKVFCSDLTATLYTVAEDVKLQVSFSPDFVEAYRLVGYENRVMDNDDFDNDAKDAGEVGAGHTVTACYELILTDAARAALAGETATAGGPWLTLSMRHKAPGGTVSELNEYSFGAEICGEASDEMRFICAVIETSMLLHNSRYISKDANIKSINDVLELLGDHGLDDVYKEQFVSLLKKIA